MEPNYSSAKCWLNYNFNGEIKADPDSTKVFMIWPMLITSSVLVTLHWTNALSRQGVLQVCKC